MTEETNSNQGMDPERKSRIFSQMTIFSEDEPFDQTKPLVIGAENLKTLPKQILDVTVFFPAVLLYSNFFTFETKEKYIARDLPLDCYWLPNELVLYYTGELLTTYDAKILFLILKELEEKRTPHPELLDAIVSFELLSDQTYQSLDTNSERDVREKEIRKKWENRQGVFLTIPNLKARSEKMGMGVSFATEKNKISVSRSIRKMGAIALRMATNIDVGELKLKSNISDTGKPVLKVIELPELEGFFITPTDMLYKIFHSGDFTNTQLNIDILTNFNSKDGISRNAQTDSFQTLMAVLTHNRKDKPITIRRSEIMNKSPQAMLLRQNELHEKGKLSEDDFFIHSSKHGYKIDNNRKKSLQNQVSRQKKNVSEHFESISQIAGIYLQTNPDGAKRGGDETYTLLIDKKLETRYENAKVEKRLTSELNQNHESE